MKMVGNATEEVEGYTVYKKWIEYKCDAGGFNTRLDWNGNGGKLQNFFVECKETSNGVWKYPTITHWPTCAASRL